MNRPRLDWSSITFWSVAILGCIGFWLFCIWATGQLWGALA